MRPDQTNTGAFEAAQKQPANNMDLQKSTPEQVVDKAGELPQTTVAAQSTKTTQDDTSQTVVVAPNPPPVSQPTVQPTTAKDQFEAELAKIPAEDADVIEKVWVEKADEIVEKTKDDPYTEDEAQHSLSRAYLKKRFNLEVD